MSAVPNFTRLDENSAKLDAWEPTQAGASMPPEALPAELLPVEGFPLEALPEAFRPWVNDVTERMQCPPDFVAVPLLVAAASLVARQVRVRPKRRDDWTGTGNLWALVVGRPAQMKSPAMAQALNPVHRLEAQAAQAFNDDLADHDIAAKFAKLKADANREAARKAVKEGRNDEARSLLAEDAEPTAPKRRRYVVNDSTYEKLGELLNENPEGLLLERDEMRGLLALLSREENQPARSFYLQAWSGAPYTFDRVGRGTLTIAAPRLSIIGAIQPGPLCEVLRESRRGASSDGLLERFLVAWPDPPTSWRDVDTFPDTAAKRRASETFERLDGLDAEALSAQVDHYPNGEEKGLPYLTLDDGALDAFREWRSEFEPRARAAESEGLEAALGKFRHHVPALALALHVIDAGEGPISETAMLRALVLADYFESHARRLYASGRRSVVQAARKVLVKVQAKALPSVFTARDVYRKDWGGLTEPAVVNEALEMLVVHRWLLELPPEQGAAGRPTSRFMAVPGVPE